MENTENKIPDLVFIYPESFPEDQIAKDISGIQNDGLDLRILKKTNGAFNGFEWIIPTAFGVYILKPYFDSFLSEAGKDHYNLLKGAIKKLVTKGKQFNSSVIPASQSTDKLSKTYSQSFIISLECQTIDNRRIKLLFDNKLENTDWVNAVDQMLDLLEENFENYPNDKLTSEIIKVDTKQHRIIYAIINPDNKLLEFRNDSKMLDKYK